MRNILEKYSFAELSALLQGYTQDYIELLELFEIDCFDNSQEYDKAKRYLKETKNNIDNIRNYLEKKYYL